MAHVNVKPLYKFVEKYGVEQTVYLLKEMCQELADDSKGAVEEYWTNAALALYEAHEKIRG